MFKTVVVGVTNRATALQACGEALDLARASEATVHLVYAGDPASGQTGDAARRHANGLQESLKLSNSQAMQVHVIDGRADGAILDVAGRVDADLIVIGSQGLIRRGRFTSEVPARVLSGARCSVLTVAGAPA